MRLFNLSSMSLSNDELSALTRTRFDSLSDLITKGVYIDFHPAGVQLFLYYWVKVFGEDVFLLRLPFALMGIGSVYLIYRLGKQWYGETPALASAAVFAFLPFTILYSQFARMYSPGIFFSLVAVYGWSNYLFYSGKRKYALYWLIGTIACIHIHYFAFAFVGLLGITGLFFLRKNNWKQYLLLGAIAVLTFLAEWRIFMEQMKTGDIGGWLGAPDSDFLLTFFWNAMNRSGVMMLVVLILLIIGIFRPSDEHSKWRRMSLFWFIASFLIAYIYSVTGHPIIQYSTLLFSYPFLLLFIFSFLPRAVTFSPYRIFFLLLFSFFLISSSVTSGYYAVPRFGVFKELAHDVTLLRNRYGASTPFVINVIHPDYYRYYDSDSLIDKDNIYKVESPEQLAQLQRLVDRSGTDHFGFAWSNSIHPDEVVDIIGKKYPFITYSHAMFNSSVCLFGRSEGEKLPILMDSVFDFNSLSWKSGLSDSLFQFQSYTFSDEYGPGWELPVQKVPGSGYRVLTLSSAFKPSSGMQKVYLVLSVERKKENYIYRNVSFDKYILPEDTLSRSWISIVLPEFYFQRDLIKAYIWNPERKSIQITDFRLSVRSEHDPYR